MIFRKSPETFRPVMEKIVRQIQITGDDPDLPVTGMVKPFRRQITALEIVVRNRDEPLEFMVQQTDPPGQSGSAS